MKKIGKNIFPIFFVFLFVSFTAEAQKNTAGAGLHEIGLGLGGLNYTGDLSPKYNFTNYRPGGTMYYRFNLSPVVNFRASIITGSLGAKDSKYTDPVPKARGASFSSFLSEFGLTVEYNFLNFRPKKEAYRYSPYFTSGLCLFNSKNSGASIGVPIGIGFKYRMTKRLNLCLEMVARKTFTDKLDGVDSYFIGPHQTTNPKNTDWYYYTGVSVSWTMFSVVCPELYK